MHEEADRERLVYLGRRRRLVREVEAFWLGVLNSPTEYLDIWPGYARKLVYLGLRIGGLEAQHNSINKDADATVLQCPTMDAYFAYATEGLRAVYNETEDVANGASVRLTGNAAEKLFISIDALLRGLLVPMLQDLTCFVDGTGVPVTGDRIYEKLPDERWLELLVTYSATPFGGTVTFAAYVLRKIAVEFIDVPQ